MLFLETFIEVLSPILFQANKAEHQVKKLKQTIEDIKYRYETQLANKGS